MRNVTCVWQVPILCLRRGDTIHSAFESTVCNELLEVCSSSVNYLHVS